MYECIHLAFLLFSLLLFIYFIYLFFCSFSEKTNQCAHLIRINERIWKRAAIYLAAETQSALSCCAGKTAGLRMDVCSIIALVWTIDNNCASGTCWSHHVQTRAGGGGGPGASLEAAGGGARRRCCTAQLRHQKTTLSHISQTSSGKPRQAIVHI